MELGTGVFISAVFLGTIALFIATKDRWSWKKIVLWPLAVIVVLSLVGWIVYYGYEQYGERPKLLSEFAGIQLGEKLEDVIFRQGKPLGTIRKISGSAFEVDIGKNTYEVDAPDEKTAWRWANDFHASGTNDKPSLPPGYTLEKSPAFATIQEAKKEESEKLTKEQAVALASARLRLQSVDVGKNKRAYLFEGVDVSVKNNQIESISRSCNTDYMSVNGISCGSNGEKIIEKFGRAVRILCPKNKVEDLSLDRVYDVVKYGTRYYLNQNSVIRIMITHPTALDSDVGINWDKCS